MTDQRPDVLILDGERTEHPMEQIPGLPPDDPRFPRGPRAAFLDQAVSVASDLLATCENRGWWSCDRELIERAQRSEAKRFWRSQRGLPPAADDEVNEEEVEQARARSRDATIEALHLELERAAGCPAPPRTGPGIPEGLATSVAQTLDAAMRELEAELLEVVEPGEVTPAETMSRVRLAAEAARLLRFAPFEYRGGRNYCNTSCYRGYVATWEIRDDRLLLVKVDGYPGFYPDDPLPAEWVSGLLVVPRGDFLFPQKRGILGELYPEYLAIRIDHGLVTDRHLVPARVRYPDLDEWIAQEDARARYEQERDRLTQEFRDRRARMSDSGPQSEQLSREYQERSRALWEFFRRSMFGLTTEDPDGPERSH